MADSALHAVVTGSTEGIGYALARELLHRGHSVVISGRSQDAVDEAVARLQDEATGGARVIGVATDVTGAAPVQALWDAATEALGSVDLWINDAGVAYTMRTIVETTPSPRVGPPVDAAPCDADRLEAGLDELGQRLGVALLALEAYRESRDDRLRRAYRVVHAAMGDLAVIMLQVNGPQRPVRPARPGRRRRPWGARS